MASQKVKLNELTVGFNALEYTASELKATVVAIIEAAGTSKRLGIFPEELLVFVDEVADLYQETSFHNLAHATTVLHTAFTLLRQVRLS